MTAVAFLVTGAHLIERSLTRRWTKIALWSCGALLLALASLDPILFDPAHTLPLGGVAGAGLGLACAAAAAWWDEATPRPAPFAAADRRPGPRGCIAGGARGGEDPMPPLPTAVGNGPRPRR